MLVMTSFWVDNPSLFNDYSVPCVWKSARRVFRFHRKRGSSLMYAVFQTGAHQYTVKEGDVLTIDKIEGGAGDKITFDKVMLVGGKTSKIGAPLVDGASIEATIEEQTRNPKIIVFKYKRRKNYKKTRGHKQPVTVVKVGKINA